MSLRERKNKGELLTTSYTKLFRRVFFPALLVLLLLLYPLPQSRTVLFPVPISGAQPETLACLLLPTQGPENQVTLFVTPAVDPPEVVCVWIYNGRHDEISYGPLPLQLERRWFGLLWSSLLHPTKDLLSGCPGCMVQPIVRYIKGKSYSDFFLPSLYNHVPPGRYRVLFRYWLAKREEERIVYSEEFTMP